MYEKNLTIEDIKIRLREKFGDLITIADNQIYVKMIHPLKFIDKDFGEWETSPNNVLNKGCTHPQRKLLKRKETNKKKYGVDNVFKSDKIKTKIKEVMIEKYGADHPMRVSSIKEKTQETCLRKYGTTSPLSNPEVVEKIKQTTLNRHGVESVLSSPEVQEKIKSTWLKKYDYANPKQHPDVIEKTKETCLERFGGVAPACNDEIKKKMAETNFQKYGGIAPLCSNEIQEKVKQTNLIRYGVENPFQSKEIQEKISKINIQKYGISIKTFTDFKKHCFILPNGLPLMTYLRKFKKLKHYTASMKVYRKYGFDVLKEYIEGDKKFQRSSSLEEMVKNLFGLQKYFSNVGRRKPDFKLTDKLFLDVDGLYWHSGLKAHKTYHVEKRIEYEKMGCRLLQIRANEIEYKPDTVRSIIDNALGNTKKIFARKCIVKPIEWQYAKKFLDENHLQGYGSPSTSLGLFHNDILVMVLCTRKKKDTGVELSRLCTANGLMVLGGFSKLLSYFAKNNPEIDMVYSWCDLRYATGKGYEAVGFLPIKDVLSWSWTDLDKVYHRLFCRANLDERKLPQSEYAKEMGLVRIFDAGQRLYVKRLNHAHT